LSTARAIGDRIREADNLASLGLLEVTTGTAGAVAQLTEAVALRRKLRDNAYLAFDLSALALALARAGDLRSAKEHLDECEDMLQAGQQGVEQLQRVHWHAYLVREATGETELAQGALARARAELDLQLQQLPNDEARSAMVNKIAVNRAIRNA